MITLHGLYRFLALNLTSLSTKQAIVTYSNVNTMLLGSTLTYRHVTCELDITRSVSDNCRKGDGFGYQPHTTS